jgi:acyl CoA:acetate/3-ketoacid CoA transferase alpha subunit
LLRKAIVSHIGLNPETQQQMMSGELEVELVPQGTLIERIRAGEMAWTRIPLGPSSAAIERTAHSNAALATPKML